MPLRHGPRNFHVPLPEDVYARLKEQAAADRISATTIARRAIEEWLRQRRRVTLHEAIAAYASQQAGATDLDPDLERASLELWRGSKRARQ